MKKNFLIIACTLVALAGTLMTACSSDDSVDVVDGGVKIAPAKAPDFVLYSGSNVLYSTFKTKALTRAGESDVITAKEITTTSLDYDTEASIVSNKLQEGVNNSAEINTDFLYKADEDLTVDLYFVVGQTNQQHTLYAFYYDENGEYHEVEVWSKVAVTYNYAWDSVNNKSVRIMNGVELTVKKGYRFGFKWDGIYNQTTPSYAIQNTYYYSLTELNTLNEKTNVHAGTFEENGVTYLCLEDWGGDSGSNADYDYQDMVFRTNVALKTTTPDDKKPVIDEEPTDPDPVDPVDPQEDPVVETTDEVEVNLSLNADKSGEANGDYISTKLSIHVRSLTGVEVFIPAPAEYYCQADDMYIVLSHKDDNYVYGDNSIQTSYDVNGNTVTLTVSYEADGIRIKTDGINESVINYLKETYGDGITFEVWNYYNSIIKDAAGNDVTVTRDDLQVLLNQSTVSFLDADPGRYVNAYGAVSDYDGEVKAKLGEDGLYYPTDAITGEVIPSEYWTREPADSKDYTLYTHVNTLDCQVVPTDEGFTKTSDEVYNKVYTK